MARAWSAIVALLLVTAGLAGCIGSTDTSGDDQSTTEITPDSQDSASPAERSASTGDATSASTESGGSAGAQLLTFPQAEPLDETRWENGTFSAQETCLAGGCFTDSASQYVEISSDLLEETPTTVRAELSYETGQTPYSEPLELFVYSQDATFYSYNSTEGTGHDVVETTLLKGSEPLVLEVFYRGPTGTEPEVNYTLRVDLSSPTSRIPSGVPVAAPAQPGETITAEPAGEGEGPMRLLVYGPDDSFVTELESDGDRLEATLPEDTTSGEHVFVVSHNSPPLRLRTNQSDATMRALGYALESGDPHPIEGPQPVTWSFETSQRPLAVGMYYTDNQPAGVTVQEGQATIAGPGGTVLEDSLGCNICLWTSYYEGRITAIGAPGVTSGSYEATFEPGGEVGFSVGHMTVTYER